MLRAASAIFTPCCLNSRAKDALKPEPAPTINADENCVLSIAVSLSDCTVKWRAFQRLPEELQIAGSRGFATQKYPLPNFGRIRRATARGSCLFALGSRPCQRSQARSRCRRAVRGASGKPPADRDQE